MFASVFLTERHDCFFFRQMKNASLISKTGMWTVESLADENVVVVTNKQGEKIHVFAGRQIATQERLEILALTSDVEIADGMGIRAVIDKVISSGGVPVLPWAPGKWLGERGRIVREVIRAYSPDCLLLGDTSLRPAGWDDPGLMEEAMDLGFKVIAGSDPLPFPGEEERIGQYAISVCSQFDAKKPLAEMRRILTDPDIRLQTVGQRCSLLSVVARLIKNYQAKTSR
jgi:hypothetical protein